MIEPSGEVAAEFSSAMNPLVAKGIRRRFKLLSRDQLTAMVFFLFFFLN